VTAPRPQTRGRNATLTATVPIPFSVFPSTYKSGSKAGVEESTKLKVGCASPSLAATTTAAAHSAQVEAEAKLPAGREGHSEHKESFAVNVKPAERREKYTEDVRVFEDRTRPQHREDIHITEKTTYRQPEQHSRRTERVEFDVHRDDQ
jgi:hypothetical protein